MDKTFLPKRKGDLAVVEQSLKGAIHSDLVSAHLSLCRVGKLRFTTKGIGGNRLCQLAVAGLCFAPLNEVH